MDEFVIRTVSVSEPPSTSDSSEINSLQLVPDPESENGWRVEENPSVSLVPVEEVYTEEQLQAMNGVEYASLSEQISFLFAAVASICLVCIMTRYLKPRLRISQWISNSLMAGFFFFIFYRRWHNFLPESLSPLLPVLDMVFLFGLLTLFCRGRVSKRIYLSITFLALYELCFVLYLYGEQFLVRLCGYFHISTSPSLFPVYSWVEDSGDASWRTTVTVGVDWAGCLLLLISCIILILSVRKLTRFAPGEEEGIPRNELAAQGVSVEGESELAGYFSGIGTALDGLNFSLHTGNPVTDVVLSGQDPEAQRFISVTSYCKNNMFLIEVKNSFDGVVYGAGERALKSRKQDTHRHGLVTGRLR